MAWHIAEGSPLAPAPRGSPKYPPLSWLNCAISHGGRCPLHEWITIPFLGNYHSCTRTTPRLCLKLRSIIGSITVNYAGSITFSLSRQTIDLAALIHPTRRRRPAVLPLLAETPNLGVLTLIPLTWGPRRSVLERILG
jgi:hypothetical protein